MHALRDCTALSFILLLLLAARNTLAWHSQHSSAFFVDRLMNSQLEANLACSERKPFARLLTWLESLKYQTLVMCIAKSCKNEFAIYNDVVPSMKHNYWCIAQLQVRGSGNESGTTLHVLWETVWSGPVALHVLVPKSVNFFYWALPLPGTLVNFISHCN